MVKKVIGYGIVGLLAIVLIAGTGFIVLRPSDGRARQGRDNAPITGSSRELSTDLGLESEEGQGRGRAQTNEPGGYRGGGTGNGAANTTGQWVTLRGIVTVADTDVTLRTPSGDVVVGMGPTHYREEAGFTVSVGDEITASGYTENGEFKAGMVENHTTGQTIVLRDETGHPKWAGRGNLSNQQP